MSALKYDHRAVRALAPGEGADTFYNGVGRLPGWTCRTLRRKRQSRR